MLLPYLIVIYIVSRGYFQTSCSELHIDIIVKNKRDFSVCHRNNYFLALKVFIPFIIWICTYGSIAKDCLRPCRCNGHIIIPADNFIPYIIEFRLLFGKIYFFIRHGSSCLRIPIDHPYSPVDKSFVIKVNKHLYDRIISLVVHCEKSSVPVT